MFGTTLPYVEKSGVEESVWKVEAASKRHATDRFSKKALAEVRKFNFCSDFYSFTTQYMLAALVFLGF
jgi:hypothetical protein